MSLWFGAAQVSFLPQLGRSLFSIPRPISALKYIPSPHRAPTAEPNYTESHYFSISLLISVSFSSTVVSQHTHTHILNLLGFMFRILGLCFCCFIKKDSRILFGICESQTLWYYNLTKSFIQNQIFSGQGFKWYSFCRIRQLNLFLYSVQKLRKMLPNITF